MCINSFAGTHDENLYMVAKEEEELKKNELPPNFGAAIQYDKFIRSAFIYLSIAFSHIHCHWLTRASVSSYRHRTRNCAVNHTHTHTHTRTKLFRLRKIENDEEEKNH